MKRILLLLLSVFVLTACAPVSSGFVALPDGVRLAIDVVVVGLLSLGIEFIVARVPFLAFLRAYAQEWGLMISALLIPWIENLLPGGAFEAASLLAVQFVLALIAAWLAARRFLARRGVKAFQPER